MMVTSKEFLEQIKKIKSSPDSVQKILQLGMIYHNHGDKVEARHYFDKAIEDYPDQLDGYVTLGTILFNNGEYDAAANLFSQASKIKPDLPDGYIGLAKVFLKLNGPLRAEETIDRALKLAPNNADVIFNAIMVKMQLHNYYHAQELIQKSLGIENNSFLPYVTFVQGLLYSKQNYFTKALDWFKKCSGFSEFTDKTSPNYLALMNNLALVHFRLGNYPDSEAIFKDLTTQIATIPVVDNNASNDKNGTSFVSIWLNYAQVFWIQDKIEDAVKAFDMANKLQPNAWPWSKELTEYRKTGAEGLKAAVKNLKKENPGGNNISLYLGCVIPNRYPFIELASRFFLDSFGIGVKDLEGASCCPAPGVFRSFDINTWMTIAARNITLSEDLGRDLITMCNGCYGTLNDVNCELHEDAEKKAMVNAHLKKINREYKGNVKVRHIMEIIYNDIGVDVIKKRITNPLSHLNIAVHYGCHIIKPHDNKPWDGECEAPEFLDKVVEVTGAKSIPYKDKMMCCGAGGAVRTGAKEVAIDFTKEKLMNMREAGVDAVVVCCPFCHLQFDLGQNEVNQTFKDQIGEPFRIPVIYITQLLGLAMGLDPFKMGVLKTPKTKGVSPFIPYEPIFTKTRDLTW